MIIDFNKYSMGGGGSGGGSGSDPNAVKYTPQTLTDAQKAQARTNIGAGTYSKPSDGIPASDLATGAIPDVSGSYTKPSTGTPATDLAADAIPVVPVDTAIPSGGLDANVHYALGTLTGSVSITLDTTTEVSGQMNIYSLAFTAGSTAPTITWPSDITSWAGNCLDSNGAPVITAGNSYEVSIVDGMAVITEFVA